MGHRPIWDHRLVGVEPDKPVVEPGRSPSAPSFLDATDRNDICRWAMRRCAERTTELCAPRTVVLTTVVLRNVGFLHFI